MPLPIQYNGAPIWSLVALLEGRFFSMSLCGAGGFPLFQEQGSSPFTAKGGSFANVRRIRRAILTN